MVLEGFCRLLPPFYVKLFNKNKMSYFATLGLQSQYFGGLKGTNMDLNPFF